MLTDRRRTFVYLARPASPELVEAVNALGEPGLVFNREPERIYPQTALAGHVIGWTAAGGRGIAGMERVLQARLADPAQRGRPVALSLDTRVQAVLESELANAVTTMRRRAAAASCSTSRRARSSPWPRRRSSIPTMRAGPGRRAMMNRATVGVYELGSTFKPITIAAAMEAGVVRSMNQRYNVSAPIQVGRFRIRDDHSAGSSVNIPELMVHSSNIATAQVADAMGPERMQAAFRNLGFDRLAPIEIERGRPLWPRDWGRLTVMTSGYGHGVAISPLHLASAYAALVNGGICGPRPCSGSSRARPCRAAGSIRNRPATGSASCCVSW